MWGMEPFGDLIIGIAGIIFIWFFGYTLFFLKEMKQ